MSVLLKRLQNVNVTDNLPSTFIDTQGGPLFRIARLDQTLTNPNSNTQGDLYQTMKNCYINAPTQFAFNRYGSIGNAYDGTIFYTSPFDTKVTFSKITDLIQPSNPDNNIGPMVFGQISKYNTQNALGGKSAVTYVSPSNGKFILNIKPDPSDSTEFVFSIYANPLQDPNLSSDDIKNNLSTLCNLISNADPMCFCSGNICTQSALGGPNNAAELQTNSPSDYSNIQNNCACLSSACQYAAYNEPNKYTAGFKDSCKNGTVACNSKFEFVPSQGVFSPNDQTYLWNQCNLGAVNASYNQAQTSQLPPPIPTDTGTGSGTDSGTDNKPPPSGSNAPTAGTKIIISIIIIAIILGIAYFFV